MEEKQCLIWVVVLEGSNLCLKSLSLRRTLELHTVLASKTTKHPPGCFAEQGQTEMHSFSFFIWIKGISFRETARHLLTEDNVKHSGDTTSIFLQEETWQLYCWESLIMTKSICIDEITIRSLVPSRELSCHVGLPLSHILSSFYAVLSFDALHFTAFQSCLSVNNLQWNNVLLSETKP